MLSYCLTEINFQEGNFGIPLESGIHIKAAMKENQISNQVEKYVSKVVFTDVIRAEDEEGEWEGENLGQNKINVCLRFPDQP